VLSRPATVRRAHGVGAGFQQQVDDRPPSHGREEECRPAVLVSRVDARPAGI
jgi:hypothetical protein